MTVHIIESEGIKYGDEVNVLYMTSEQYGKLITYLESIKANILVISSRTNPLYLIPTFKLAIYVLSRRKQ